MGTAHRNPKTKVLILDIRSIKFSYNVTPSRLLFGLNDGLILILFEILLFISGFLSFNNSGEVNLQQKYLI